MGLIIYYFNITVIEDIYSFVKKKQLAVRYFE
jgi:hypothetical protein